MILRRPICAEVQRFHNAPDEFSAHSNEANALSAVLLRLIRHYAHGQLGELDGFTG